jgi:hypothetical protein
VEIAAEIGCDRSLVVAARTELGMPRNPAHTARAALPAIAARSPSSDA